MAFVAKRTRTHGSLCVALGGRVEIGWRIEIGLLNWFGCGQVWVIEFQTQAHLRGLGAFGRVPEAEVADLVKSPGQDMLEEAAHELVARQSTGAPAR